MPHLIKFRADIPTVFIIYDTLREVSVPLSSSTKMGKFEEKLTLSHGWTFLIPSKRPVSVKGMAIVANTVCYREMVIEYL